MTTRLITTALCVLAALSAVPTGSVYAQASTDPALEEVLVTGSRIKRSGTTTPVPVTVLGEDEFRLSTALDVAEALNDLPSLGDTVTASNTAFEDGAGLNLLDLRRLGTNRTLVLVNGRRHVGSQASTTAVDINNIPPALIDRIEVMTGSASAVYGADAVSGVVNIVLKEQVDGIELDLRTGQTDESDGDRHSFSLTAGGAFVGGGSATVNLSWDETDVISALDRDFGVQRLFGPNPNDPDGPQILHENITYNFWGARGNVYNGNDANGNTVDLTNILGPGPIAFDSNLNPVAADLGTVIDLGNFGIGGVDVFEPRLYQQFQQPQEKVRFTGVLRLPISENMEFSLDAGFLNSESTPGGQAATNFTAPFVVAIDNPYVTPALREFMADNGVESINVRRTFEELGGFRTLFDNTTYRFAPGVEGTFGNWDYEAYYSYGRTDADLTQAGVLLRNIDQAVDAVLDANGDIVCRDPSGGCVPINVLGPAVQPEAVSFSFGDAVTQSRLEQQVVNFSVTNSELLTLPAGPMGFAAGIEYREEKSSTDFGGGEQTEGFFREFGVLLPVDGEYDVIEVFGEVLVPLVAGKRWIEELNMEAAVRLSDYSTVGSTDSWKLGFDWKPINDVRLRANFSQAVRAPNVGELFAPTQSDFQFLLDPCDSDRIDDLPERSQSCQALGIPAEGFSAETDALSAQVNIAGNPNLDPEESETLTLGIVYTPSQLAGFSITADYWDVEIDDAINIFDSQTILNGCTDFGNIDNEFCAAINRGADFNIDFIENSQVNVSKFEARGVDLEARYGFDLNNGAGLDFSLIATFLDKLDFFVIPANPESKLEEAGELGDPETMFNLRTTYAQNNFTVSGLVRYMDSMVFSNQDPPGLRTPNDTGNVWYLDLSARYQLGDNYTLYGGIENALAEDPPLIARHQLLTILGSEVGLFDWAGRAYFVGLRVAF